MPTSIIGSLPRFAASNGWSPIDDRYYEGIGQVTSSGVRVTPALAFNLSAVWACTRAVAQPLGMVPLPLYGYLENGNGRTVRRLAQQHPLYSLIHDAPNPEQTAMEFRETIVAWALNLGGGHARIIPDRVTGRPIGSLELIPPGSLTIKRTPEGTMQYIVRDDAGRSTTYLSDEIFKVRGMSLDGVTGVSVIEYARETIGEAYGQQQYGSKYWAGSSMPRGVFRYDKEVSAEMRRKMEVEFAARYSGTQNAHKTPVLPYGLQWQQIGISNKDAEWLSARQFSLGEFERWYGVPAHIIGDLMHATFCLPADALVYTDGGPRQIVDLRPGDAVWSWDESRGEWATARVARHEMSGVDPILTVKTTNRTIRLNARHRVQVRRQIQVAAVGRGGGGRGAERHRVAWEDAWIAAGDLRVGDTLVTLGELPDSGTDKAPTRAVTREFAEVVGYYLGNGNLMRGRSGHSGLSFARAHDDDCFDHYRRAILESFTKSDGSPVRLQETERATRFSSASAAKEFDVLDLAHTAKHKTVPQWVFRLNSGLRLSVLRGFVDSDGSVDKKGRISFSSSSKALLDGIRHLCMGLGIPVTNIRRHEGVTRLPNGRMTTFVQWYTTASDPGANRRIGSNIRRYQERIADGKPFDRKGRHYPWHGGKDFAFGPRDLARITSIDVGPVEPVYDIEVEGTHSFIADGVVVHNSNIEEQSLEYLTYTLHPWGVRVEQAIKRDLIFEPEIRAKHVWDALLRGRTKERYEAHNLAIMAGWKSGNEVRELEELDPIDGLDEYLIPANMVPLSQLSQRITALGSQANALALDAAERLVTIETREVQRAAVDHGNGDGWQEWVDEFYGGEYAEKLAKMLHITPEKANAIAGEHRRELLTTGAKQSLARWNIEAPGHLAGVAVGVEREAQRV